MAPTPEGYDPRRSKVSDNSMEQFRTGTLTGDLKEVPGIGPAAAKRLEEEGILTTYHLLGHYMKMAEMTKNDDDDMVVDTYLLNQQMWQFLKGASISAHRSAIVKAVSEKVASSFPAFHDANIYDDDDV
mmetsp:Transcript_4648/g.6050  ORF Transcript_4648/g.6050 Transcript_4648/m.6050 type:complete len:129 (-) Transcript_4648:146-532(-)|eukprot:CAMPEP_0198136568 /NCGR_PEP_ID=MMETSP1443-20131203/216_1 /TAXON_ID=186043 /ORGANISM="Entomoneis sp., Strain CCMP2396" /LENGTH=128 /DNA_ID=CAMNT_0043797815 /DNA_START=173 /DNA_END=559 /DNA_ORIENTATION=-